MIRKVHIAVSIRPDEHPYFWSEAARLKTLFQMNQGRDVQLVDSPEHADTIIFVGSSDPALVDIRQSPAYRGFPKKCFVFHGGDEPLPTLPGIYASLPARWHDPNFHRGGFYLRVTLDQSIENWSATPARFLYSFVGAMTNHRAREGLRHIQDDRALLIDSTRLPLPIEDAKPRFLDSLRDTLFVVCPRGGGTSSFRIFEAMKAGRVPVIVSDQWVEPLGPEWPSFSVRLPERDLPNLALHLRGIEDCACAMGRMAREAWENWFSPETAASTILDWISQIEAGIRTAGAHRMSLELGLSYATRRVKRRLVGLARPE